ncbi:MAG: DUF1203 domain-containing protein [Marmoricola sp.]
MDTETGTTHPFHLHTVDPEAIAAARSTGRDYSGDPVARLDTKGGEPLRCCLRNAQPGEQALLLGYRPPLPPSPYVETGAVFVHAAECPGPHPTTRYPADWLGKPQVLRAYDDRGWIHPASRTHDGADPESAISDVLAQPGVVEVHSRNIVYGCFMFSATRST